MKKYILTILILFTVVIGKSQNTSGVFNKVEDFIVVENDLIPNGVQIVKNPITIALGDSLSVLFSSENDTIVVQTKENLVAQEKGLIVIESIEGKFLNFGFDEKGRITYVLVASQTSATRYSNK